MRLLRAGLGGEAEADDRAAGDHRGPVRHRAGGDDRLADRVRVVAVDLEHVPAGGAEAPDLVVGDREAGRAVDRDRVVVPEGDEPAELEVAGERDRLLADALHQAAVAQEDVGVMVDEVVPEPGVHDALAERHADRLGHALAQRARRQLDAVGVAVLGMARGPAPDLAEAPQLLERHVLVAGQVEQAVEQHRAVAVREDEAVAVDPVRVGGVEPQEVLEQDGGDVGHAHGRAGMPALGLLHGVHGQEADAIRHVAEMPVTRCGHGLRRGLSTAISHEITPSRRPVQARSGVEWLPRKIGSGVVRP